MVFIAAVVNASPCSENTEQPQAIHPHHSPIMKGMRKRERGREREREGEDPPALLVLLVLDL